MAVIVGAHPLVFAFFLLYKKDAYRLTCRIIAHDVAANSKDCISMI